MRARVYIDGFNLYFRLLKKSKCKWIDLKKFSQDILEPTDEIIGIRYFTADVSPRAGDEQAPERQSTYFRALKTIPELTIHKGSFLSKTITRPLVSDPDTFVEVHDTEEKGSDVNLASHLLMDAFSDSFDVALVISQDTDLIEPIRMVAQELGKTVVVAWMESGDASRKLKNAASSVRHVHLPVSESLQFPNPVIGRGGAKIWRPLSWDPKRE